MAYCGWGTPGELLGRYHDEEWGTPLFDDVGQFEYLSLEVMQCGLNFGLVLRKREILRACFAGFDYDRVATFGEDDVARIMRVDGMIRSRKKIEAVIGNAAAFRRVREEFGSFSDYLWKFTKRKTILYQGHEKGLIPASNRLSEKVAADLKARGFRFTGAIVIYSHMQACGMINDHDEDCPRRKALIERYPTVVKRRLGEKGTRQY